MIALAEPVRAAAALAERLAALGVPLADLTTDSRAVKHGSVFLAYPGSSRDGRLFIGDAIARGAAAVLWEGRGFDWRPEWAVPNLAVEDLRGRASEIARIVYGDPSAKLWMVGVTGTNGKTSVAQWVGQAFDGLGRPASAPRVPPRQLGQHRRQAALLVQHQGARLVVDRRKRPWSRRIIRTVKNTGVPVIHFVYDGGGLLEQVRDTGADVVGLDWRVDIDVARRRLGAKTAVQGNLDPCSLFLPEKELRAGVREVLRANAGRRGHVFNLGHGILPQCSVRAAQVLVDEVHKFKL